jgi:hypothetical protein
MKQKLKIALWLVIAAVLIATRYQAWEHHASGWTFLLDLANVTWAGLFWFMFWRRKNTGPDAQKKPN